MVSVLQKQLEKIWKELIIQVLVLLQSVETTMINGEIIYPSFNNMTWLLGQQCEFNCA